MSFTLDHPGSVIAGFVILLTVGDPLGVGPPSVAAVPILVGQDVVTELGKQPVVFKTFLIKC